MTKADSLEIRRKAWLTRSEELDVRRSSLKPAKDFAYLLALGNLATDLKKHNKEGEEIIAQYILRHKGRVVQ